MTVKGSPSPIGQPGENEKDKSLTYKMSGVTSSRSCHCGWHHSPAGYHKHRLVSRITLQCNLRNFLNKLVICRLFSPEVAKKLAGADGTTLAKAEGAWQREGVGAVWGELLLSSGEGGGRGCRPTSAGGGPGFLWSAGDQLQGSPHCGWSSQAPCQASWHRPACPPAPSSG